jgi:hypothetical protein
MFFPDRTGSRCWVFGREAGRFGDLPAEGGGNREWHPHLRMPF